VATQRRGVSSQALALALLTCLCVGRARGADSMPHFRWDAIPVTQFENQAFTVTLTAREATDAIATNFQGAVSFSAVAAAGPSTNMILGPVSHSDFFDYGAFTLGYGFTPTADLLVTHWRHYAGSKVSLWTDAGELLASQNVPSVPGSWLETPLASPVVLNAGRTYRIAFYVSGTNYYWIHDGPMVFRDGAIHGSYEVAGDAFPGSPDSVQWWLVDLRYAVCAPVPVAVSPSAVPLAQGIWTGLVVVPSPLNSMFLRAVDGAGHNGDSNPLQVLPAGARRLQFKRSNHQLILAWPATVEGFVLEKSDNVSGPAHWCVVTNPATQFGSQWVLTNPMTAGSSFFRLKK
jgi:hypothetical protein